MKKLIGCLLCLLLSVCAFAQQGGGMHLLSKDSIRSGYKLEGGWKYKEADDTGMSQVNYDDSGWDEVWSTLGSNKKGEWAYAQFNSVAWLRWHFIAAPDLVNTPLALTIKHNGASEIFLDGKRLAGYGYIGGKDSTEYMNIQGTIPLVFVVPLAGHHVLAVRYANYNARKNRSIYNAEYPGFEMKLGTANALVTNLFSMSLAVTVIMMVLFGIFLALSIAHFFLFLYQRSVRSNLFFSIMCFSLALLSMLPWMSIYSGDVGIGLSDHFIVPALTAAFCFSISGFVNTQFSAKKRRFYVIAVSCIVVPILYYLDIAGGHAGLVGFAVLINAAMFEAIVVIIRAIYKRVRGANIIGAGMLMFTIFVFVITAYISVFQQLSIEGEGNGAFIMVIIAALAFLSLPISMSLFLAWNFASVNKELKLNLAQVQELSAKTIEQELERVKLVETQNEKLEAEVKIRTAEVVTQKDEIEQQHSELKAEKQKSDDLLLNILPAEIAEELKEKGQTAARLYNDVSVIFTDFVAFTKAGERMTPQELVDELHSCFKGFDEIIVKHNIEKIKTIGDAYLAVGGLPQADAAHAENAVSAAIEILEFMKSRKELLRDKTFQIRIGIHSGSVVAGIVGIKKFAYDIWGDTVNTAARMEQNSESDKINISASTYELVKDKFECEHRGKIDAKNKGELHMYFVVSRKS